MDQQQYDLKARLFSTELRLQLYAHSSHSTAVLHDITRFWVVTDVDTKPVVEHVHGGTTQTHLVSIELMSWSKIRQSGTCRGTVAFL